MLSEMQTVSIGLPIHVTEARLLRECIARHPQRVEQAEKEQAEKEREAAERREAKERAEAEVNARSAALVEKYQRREQAVSEIVNDPARRAVVLSGSICFREAEKSGAESTIADERKKARIAGVVDKVVLNDAGNAIVAADKEIAWAKAKLRSEKLKQIKCDDEQQKTVSFCIGSEDCPSQDLRYALVRALELIHSEK